MNSPTGWAGSAELDQEFDRLLSLPLKERERALQELATSQPVQAAQLRDLLQIAGRLDADSDTHALAAPAALWSALDGQFAKRTAPRLIVEAPARIGAWRLLQELGSGGMGRVFLVERIDAGFEQRAALKRIRSDIDSSTFLAHFARERQFLARLAHSGIARLIDGGEEPCGRPYLVVEYVEGEPIDLHCRRHCLDLHARLLLWQQVAEALAYAHAQHVVHRDIKPSNVLVSVDGVVKLLDFGIAKSLTRSEDSADTGTAAGLLTPQWASPEQVLGQPVAEASDQYQLALLLYLLISGVHPQQPRDRDELAWIQRICEQVPPAPSRVVSRDGAQSALPGEVNRLGPRRSQGDLDRVVLKALSKRPAQRYANVCELIDDIERWRQGFPVRARKPALAYRLRRLVGRHRGASAAVTVAALLLLAFVFSLGKHATDLALQRDLAEQAAQQAQQSQQLMLRLFEQADPEHSGQVDLSLREALATGLASLEHELAGQPQLEYPLLLTIARVHQQLGLPQQALLLLQRAEALEPKIELDLLAGLERRRLTASVTASLGDADSARPELRQIQALALAQGSPEALELSLSVQRDLGWLEHRAGRTGAALETFTAVFRVREQAAEPLALAKASDDLGVALRNAGRYAEAAPYLQRAHALLLDSLPPSHPLLVHSRVNLAANLRSLGRESEAEVLYREALAGSLQVRGERHPGTAVIQNNLARLLKVQGRLDEAESLLKAALATRAERLGDQHPQVAMTYSDLGWLMHDRGDLDSAHRYYAEALARYPSGHPWRAATVFNQGRVHEARDELAQAEALYREALAAQQAEYGPEHERVGIDWLQLSGVLRKQKRWQPALQALDAAERIFQKALPPEHDRFAQVLMARAELAEARADGLTANTLWQQALAQRERTLGPADSRTLALRKRLAER